jgi:glucans biosynthesis protein
MNSISRRRVLAGTAQAAFIAAFAKIQGREAFAEPALGEAAPFDWQALVARARDAAQTDYVDEDAPLPPEVTNLAYDQHRAIRYKAAEGLWRGSEGFEAQFFHLGAYFQRPVHIFEVADGHAREILYDQTLFDLGPNTLPQDLPDHMGYAGFRLHYALNEPEIQTEFAVFLGDSYFRAIGRGARYGLSARGLAIDTASRHGEEFPDFRAFWLERPAPGATSLTVFALLDSPSCTGAYRFVVTPGDTTVTEVEAVLFARRDIETLGIAPLTSMFLFGAADDRGFDDFRAAVHDSDGLSMHSGAGEWIWRPLRNPARLQVSAFSDDNPRGFGLMQGARGFKSFQDLEVRYELRPSAWVEPLAGWGPGQIRLVEIPTDFEIHDNIVAFWVPAAPVTAGSEWRVTYRLHWGLGRGFVTDRGRVILTRHGEGHVSGSGEGRGNRKFVIDFQGGRLSDLADGAPVEAVVWSSAGTILSPSARRNGETGGWRASFDLEPAGDAPVELRCFLRVDGDALTETWSFQWIPAS